MAVQLQCSTCKVLHCYSISLLGISLQLYTADMVLCHWQTVFQRRWFKHSILAPFFGRVLAACEMVHCTAHAIQCLGCGAKPDCIATSVCPLSLLFRVVILSTEHGQFGLLSSTHGWRSMQGGACLCEHERHARCHCCSFCNS